MKRFIALFILAALTVFGQTTQDKVSQTNKAGFFDTAFCPQWADTSTVPVMTDTLWFKGAATLKSGLFRNWPYLSGVINVIEDDSLVLQAVQVWTSPVNDTTKMAYSKTLLFTPRYGGTADSALTATGTYAVDFANGGSWAPMLYMQLRAVPGTDNKKSVGNKARFIFQGYHTK